MFINATAPKGVIEKWEDLQIESAKALSKTFTGTDDDELVDIIIPDIKVTATPDSVQKIVSDIIIKIYTTAPNGAVVYVDHTYELSFNIILALETMSVATVEGMSAKYLVVDAVYDTKRIYDNLMGKNYARMSDKLPFVGWREYSPILLNANHYMYYAKTGWLSDNNPTAIYMRDVCLESKLHPDD